MVNTVRGRMRNRSGNASGALVPAEPSVVGRIAAPERDQLGSSRSLTRRQRSRAHRLTAVLVVWLGLTLSACSPTDDTSGPDETTPQSAPSTTTGQQRPPSSDVTPTETRRLPPYAASIGHISPTVSERMRYSYRDGCPVPLRDLRYLRMLHVGWDDLPREGEMVVHKDLAGAVVRVFRRLYEARWPVQRMRLVDAYRGDDAASMAANNTSGFNCREVTGGGRLSEHAYGRAIDVNPVQNPYVRDALVDPPAGRRYAHVDRTGTAKPARGVVVAGDVVTTAFRDIGWTWGGSWSSGKDYQHFSATGR